MNIFLKSINHPNHENGYCYLHHPMHRNYPHLHHILNADHPNVLYQHTRPIPNDYIEIHNTKYHEEKFFNIMNVETPRYCILVQHIRDFGLIITHVNQIISQTIKNTAIKDQNTIFLHAVEGKVLAYLDPNKIKAHRNLATPYTEYHVELGGLAHAVNINQYFNFVPDYGTIYHVPNHGINIQQVLSDLTDNPSYTILNTI
jgi:hypothetical protein